MNHDRNVFKFLSPEGMKLGSLEVKAVVGRRIQSEDNRRRVLL